LGFGRKGTDKIFVRTPRPLDVSKCINRINVFSSSPKNQNETKQRNEKNIQKQTKKRDRSPSKESGNYQFVLNFRI
jgi:hypothetical protein